MVMMIHKTRLTEMKNLLSVQPESAKNPYKTPVKEIVAAYMPPVEPMRIHCQRFESEFSQLLRQVSDHEWAKSTSKTSPRRMKMVAPMRDT